MFIAKADECKINVKSKSMFLVGDIDYDTI